MELKEQTNPEHPQIAHIARYLVIIFITVTLLYFGSFLFVPLFYGLLVAIVMYPVCKWLESRRVPRSVAITIALSIVVLLFGSLLWLLWFEFNYFRKDLPEIINKMQLVIPRIQEWISRKFSLSESTQQEWLGQMIVNTIGNVSKALHQMLNYVVGISFMLFMIPIFAALFLYHRGNFVHFLQLVFGKRHKKSLDVILQETIHTYFNYIKGLVLVYLIVGILNSIGLLALGINHAILFGMVTAIMTIIPYLGILVSALLPITVAFLTKDSILYPIGIVLIFSFVQYLEANVIFPKVVGAQLNVSTWATLVAILAGGIIWGVSGMVLFIPFVGIFKIISDHVEEWSPINVLLRR
jgi:predicted PurR-regulated permease PerM